MTLKNRLKKLFLWAAGLFVILFLFRVAYGFYTYPKGSEVQNSAPEISRWYDTAGFLNIASSKYQYKKSLSGSHVVHVDQKFEKIANIACRSKKFEKDEEHLRQTIKSNNTIIQFQQESGNAGNRELYLQIGVPPQAFDPFIERIQQHQNVTAITITKKDKTNEYRELNAKRNTLSNTRKALVALKEKGGKIEEYIQLENSIVDVDEKLQALGVQLGNFDTENEFCTVNISLVEGKTHTISVVQRVKVSLQWTIKYYVMLMAGLFLAFGAAYLLILILDKLKQMLINHV